MRLNFGVGWDGDDTTSCGLGLVAGAVRQELAGVGHAQSPQAGAGAGQANAQQANSRSGQGLRRRRCLHRRRLPGHRTRLILKDGSYQVVMSYQVNGNVVRYYSAERDATEEIPAELIDWDRRAGGSGNIRRWRA